MQADQHGAHLRGAVAAHRRRGLDSGITEQLLRRAQRAAVGSTSRTLPGWTGCRRHGLWRPGVRRCGLAAKTRNQLVVNVQCDGDLNYAPGVLWTAQHHRLPMLTIMHNNRAWHQELMFVEYNAASVDAAPIATTSARRCAIRSSTIG